LRRGEEDRKHENGSAGGGDPALADAENALLVRLVYLDPLRTLTRAGEAC
jgi:hypothetical protein